MKRICSIAVAAMLLGLTACGSGGKGGSSASALQNESSVQSQAGPAAVAEAGSTPDEAPPPGTRILVVYFSNTGTTRTIAVQAAEALKADLYEIQPVEPYTDADLDYRDNDSRASLENADLAVRPAISGGVEGMEGYDTVLLGYPIWWGEAPRILCSFLESYDFSGKTIVPFCTSGSSGVGSSVESLQALCADSTQWLPGIRFGSGASADDIMEWIEGLDLAF